MGNYLGDVRNVKELNCAAGVRCKELKRTYIGLTDSMYDVITIIHNNKGATMWLTSTVTDTVSHST